jgi:hypothetical protein
MSDLDTGIYTYYRLNGTEVESTPLDDPTFLALVDLDYFGTVSVPVGLSLQDAPPFSEVSAP